MLGDISKKYESGKSGPGTISTGKGDPGGKSYGSHQLAIKTGTLTAYLNDSSFGHHFDGMAVGGSTFDMTWKKLAQNHPQEFEEDQRAFIKRTHYDDLREYASDLGIESTPAINEALFSIGVQHGKAERIVANACTLINITEEHEEDVIWALYQARRVYVSKLKLSSALKQSLMNRYDSEEQDVLELIQD